MQRICPVCRRVLDARDRLAFEWAGWRRGVFAGCEQCAPPCGEKEYLLYEAWEVERLCF